MSDDIKINVVAKDTSAEQMFRSHEQALTKIVDKMNRLERASDDAGKKAKAGFDGAASAAGNFAGQLVGASSATDLIFKAATAIKAEWEHIAQLQKGVAAANISTADAVAKAKLNFTADATVSDSELEGKLQGIAKRTGVSVAAVAQAASGAFSAGAKDNQQSLDAIEAGFELAPFDAGQASELGQRSIDLAKATGADPKAAIGFLLNTGKAARTTDLQKLGSQGLPAMLSVMAQGDSAEQAAELFATISQIKGDKEGSVSKTIATNLAEQLGAFGESKALRGVPKESREQFKAATSTADRIALMQANPKLRAAFLADASFGSEGNAAVRNLLSGEESAMRLYQQSQDTINPLDDRQLAAFEEKRRSIAEGRFEGVAAAQRDAETSLETFNLANTKGARESVARGIVDSIADRSGLGLIGRNLARAEFEGRAAFGNPEEAAIAVAERIQERTKGAGSQLGGFSQANSDPEFKSFLAEQIQILKRMEKSLATPQQVHVLSAPDARDPGRPPKPVPSARRGN